MTDKGTILQVFGSLMKHPQFLSQSDKYQLTPNDFETRFEKYIYIAIDSLYRSGVTSINPIDVENYLENNAAAKTLFEKTSRLSMIESILSSYSFSTRLDQNIGLKVLSMKKWKRLIITLQNIFLIQNNN